MSYPIPIQVHLIWHPDSDKVCRPLAEKLYTALNRDAYQPLVPGIGIPVFFRCAGSNPAAVTSVPAPIAVPDTEYDLRVVLLTPELVLDDGWRQYIAANYRDIAGKRDRAKLFAISLRGDIADGDEKAIRLDAEGDRLGEQILQHVLLQACRLIAQRPRSGGSLGAAPLKLFLSHTKRDKLGLQIAQAVKSYLDGMAIDRFFDDVSIQPGDNISDELKLSIEESALVAIRTDSYVASPWCRMEVALAKRARRPMVVLDALFDKEARSSPFLANLPSIRIAAETIVEDMQLERVANFLALEVLRFLHAQLQLRLLQEQGLVSGEAILLPRQPELRDLAIHLKGSTSPSPPSRTFVHPDPTLSAEESEDYAAYNATFTTPTSVWSKKLAGLQLGISVSLGDANEERALGLSRLHLEDATRIIARQTLAAGATLVYGGALGGQPGRFTEALFEMIGAYNKGGFVSVPPLINYAAWPWSEEVDKVWLASRFRMLNVKPWPLPPGVSKPDAGEGPGRVRRLAATAEGRYVLARSLSHMRAEITQRTHARVVLGGKPHSFMGIIPGIVEEALLAIRKRQPLYVFGGFGGAAGLVAQALLGQHPESLTLDFQQQASPEYAALVSFYDRQRSDNPEMRLPAVDYQAIVQELATYGPAALGRANGLSMAENEELFTTGSVDSALFLLMKGLSSIALP